MDQAVYDIYFQGEALEGFDISLVKQNMARLFQANAQTLAALFSGKTVLLKKELSKEDALKYQTLLKKAGARIIVKARRVDAPAAGTPAPAIAPTTGTSAGGAVQPAAPLTASVSEAPATPSWSLAPAGADLLKPGERPQPAAVQVDTSALSVAAPSPLPSVAKAPPPPPPDTSGISIAEVGATLGTGEQDRINAQAVVPDVDFDVAEAGATLSEESIEIPLPEPDISDFTLAAAGSRLGPETTAPPAQVPDTSHLSVVPNQANT